MLRYSAFKETYYDKTEVLGRNILTPFYTYRPSLVFWHFSKKNIPTY